MFFEYFFYLCAVDEFITILRSEYEQMQREIVDLRTMVQQLKDEISLLKGGKDSRTSSTPSSHDLGRSNRISLRVSSNRKPGGQPGHTGHSLSLSETPDEIIDHHPDKCQQCGADLQSIDSASFVRRQIVDIPLVSPLYIEHRVHAKTCPQCRFENRGSFPSTVQSPIQYGAGIEAMTGYLSVYQSLPYHRISKLFGDFFGLRLSQGSIDTFLENLSQKSTSVYHAIRDKIKQSAVVGADETGCRAGGQKYWFHVWQTPLLTFIVAFANRGYKVIETYFKDGFPLSVYISDCWSAQLKVIARLHQLCMAHLLRELTNFSENLNSWWSAQMKELFLHAIELKKQMNENDYLNPPAEVFVINEKLDELLGVDFSKFHRREQAFIKRLNKHRKSILTFLTCQEVPPDNNASERAIRNVKIKTKVSGEFRNKEGKGAERYAKIRSVIDTTIKNGQEVYAALFDLAMGKMVGIPE